MMGGDGHPWRFGIGLTCWSPNLLTFMPKMATKEDRNLPKTIEASKPQKIARPSEAWKTLISDESDEVVEIKIIQE